jgi:hypothetical protein
MKCDCVIGTCGRDDVLRKSSYVEILNDASRTQRKLYEMGLLKHAPLSPKAIADARRGYVHRYNFCPYCGAKHDWKQLTEAL